MTTLLDSAGSRKLAAFLHAYPFLLDILGLILVILSCGLAFRLTRRWVKVLLIPFLLRLSNHPWLDLLIKENPLQKLAHMLPALMAYHLAGLTPVPMAAVKNLALIWLLWAFLALIQDIFDATNSIYSTFEVSRNRPIKGFLQVAKLILFILGLLLSFSLLLNKSPLFFLSGLGALTAVLLLIFKDTILSVVASVQIQTNDMVRIGDWIEMPQYNADGDVIDMALHTVKVQNWDKTITTIPTSKLIEESFKNWRGMQQSGGRRICRNLLIDTQSVRFLGDPDLENLMKVQILKNYLTDRTKEVKDHNDKLGADIAIPINGRRLTNLGTFRAYLKDYLKNHPRIRQDMTLMVRLLEPTAQGIPMQIYCFTNTTVWAEYEGIQSDLFDHILAALPQFGLSIFQNPSGMDFKSLGHMQREVLRAEDSA